MRQTTQTNRSAGFSLVELMIAIGIFAIGAIAVASIFPVAILLQKQTMDDGNARAFAESATAMVLARGFDAASVQAGVTGSDTVYPVPAALDDWEVSDRSYRSGLNLENRRVFWVPLFFADDHTQAAVADRGYRVYLFVVQSRRNATYPQGGAASNWANQPDAGAAAAVPGVRRITASVSPPKTFAFDNDPRLVRTGEKVLDELGRDWIVTKATDTGIEVNGTISGTGSIDLWAADPGTSGSSSYVNLVTLKHDSTNRLIR